MATQRFNYNDKFSLKNQKVGIVSTTPEESLDVASGTLKGVDLQSNSGITTFSTYEGFLNSKTSYTGNVQIKKKFPWSKVEKPKVMAIPLGQFINTLNTSEEENIKQIRVLPTPSTIEVINKINNQNKSN